MSADIFTNDKMELTIQGRQRFMGKEIPVVLGGFGEGKRCVSDKTIAEIHKMEPKHVRERISQNINRFKKSVDYIDIKQRVGETGTLEFLLQAPSLGEEATMKKFITYTKEQVQQNAGPGSSTGGMQILTCISGGKHESIKDI